MIHKHHEWLADLNKSIVESYQREQAVARQAGRTQEIGHVVESLWDGVLTDWLPPQYELRKRKYILLENEDGTTSPKETDLVIFHPHYPEKLRKKSYVLAAGVAAAFSVRRTIGRKDIEEAYKEGIALRRGMQIRDESLKSHLVPPLFFGLLAESHDWKSPGSSPKENIRAITDDCERDLVQAPREGLDLLCVADLGSWDRVTMVMPEKFLKEQLNADSEFSIFTNAYGTESLALSSIRHDYEQTEVFPLTHFIGSLWNKLALNDTTLKPIADGFRITNTEPDTGTFAMGSGPYNLASVSSVEIARSYRFNRPWTY